MITLRTPVGLLRRIDDIAESRRVTRSLLVVRALEEFIADIRRRGCLVPPYEGDEILRSLHLSRRRQAMLRYYFVSAPGKFRS